MPTWRCWPCARRIPPCGSRTWTRRRSTCAIPTHPCQASNRSLSPPARDDVTPPIRPSFRRRTSSSSPIGCSPTDGSPGTRRRATGPSCDSVGAPPAPTRDPHHDRDWVGNRDKFDKAALDAHFDAFVGKLLSTIGPRPVRAHGGLDHAAHRQLGNGVAELERAVSPRSSSSGVGTARSGICR